MTRAIKHLSQLALTLACIALILSVVPVRRADAQASGCCIEPDWLGMGPEDLALVREERILTRGLYWANSMAPSQVGKSLLVDQENQILRAYEDGVLVRRLPISTGQRYFHTPAFVGRVGDYRGTIWGYGALADHAWYLFEARGSILIHGAPYTYDDDTKVYQGIEDLGVRPVSHGCIRLHPDDAAWLAEWGAEGVPIVITAPSFDQQETE